MAFMPALAKDRFVTTKGEAFVEVPPDFVKIQMTLLAVGPDLDRLKSDVDDRAQRIMTAAAKLQIAGSDIETTGVEVEREYQSDRNDNQTLRGYEVSRDITIKLRAVAKYEEFAQALVDAKVDQIGNVTVGVDDRAALKDRALVAAARNARGKATAIAGELGIQLGLPFQVDEEKLWVTDNLNERANDRYSEVVVTASKMQGTPVTVVVFQPHQIKVDAVVWARFEIVSKE
jgi:uncharacterized protein YggE